MQDDGCGECRVTIMATVNAKPDLRLSLTYHSAYETMMLGGSLSLSLSLSVCVCVCVCVCRSIYPCSNISQLAAIIFAATSATLQYIGAYVQWRAAVAWARSRCFNLSHYVDNGMQRRVERAASLTERNNRLAHSRNEIQFGAILEFGASFGGT